MKLHASGEDYLEAVLVLQKEKGMVVSSQKKGRTPRGEIADFIRHQWRGTNSG